MIVLNAIFGIALLVLIIMGKSDLLALLMMSAIAILNLLIVFLNKEK